MMEKFRPKKIKITRIEKSILFISFFLLLLIYLVFPVQTKENIFYNKPKSIESVLKELNFKDDYVQRNIFDQKYINIVYFKNNTYESHFVNYSDAKEITINDLIKKGSEEQFNNKVRELLYYKYPEHIALALEKVNKEYVLYDNKMIIYYYNCEEAPLKKTESYFLSVNYNEIHEYLNFVPALDKEYTNEDGFSYDSTKKTIAFSFDDGPNGAKTKELINNLEKYKMSATFFMVGNKLGNNSDIVKYVYDSHSEIGYHSLNHAYFTRQSADVIKSEFAYTDTIYNSITGDHLKLTRPPYGAYDDKTLSSIDNVFVRWNLDTNDWKYKDVNYIVDYVINNITDGDIILFHDSYQTSIDAVKILIPKLYEKDYQVVNVTKLAEIKGIQIQNHEIYYDFK